MLGSFNRDGEAKAGLVEKRDKDLRVNTAEIRRNRRDLEQLAKPQEGVDALEKQIQRCTTTSSGCRREEYHERRRVTKC